MKNVLPFQERRLRSIKKAKKNNIKILEVSDFSSFWTDILTPHLREKFKTLPVHSLQEIKLLTRRFPKNIKQFNAVLDGQIVAGVTVFQDNKCAHTQYIAASAKGMQMSALDLLFWELLKKKYKNYRYFSFGTSNEQKGKIINSGLIEWKEGFGARVWPNNIYAVKTSNYTKLKGYI